MDFTRIAEAMRYIEAHLADEVDLDAVARLHGFSPYYFGRVLAAISGMPFASYIQARRLARACALLTSTRKKIHVVARDCGFPPVCDCGVPSARSFAWVFKGTYGMSSSEYRRIGLCPPTETIDDMIAKFTDRLRGGILVKPRIIFADALVIAGVSGDGAQTDAVWAKFERLRAGAKIPNRLSESGYEVRTYDGRGCEVHVGLSVSGAVSPPYTACALPAGAYAAFDVYVARGYDSENAAMDEWLRTNDRGWRQRLVDGKHVALEYYDERFQGDVEDSIVEIWVPIQQAQEA